MIRPIVMANPISPGMRPAVEAMERFQSVQQPTYVDDYGEVRIPTVYERLSASIFTGMEDQVFTAPSPDGTIVIQELRRPVELGRFRYIQRTIAVPLYGTVAVDSIYFGSWKKAPILPGHLGMLSNAVGSIFSRRFGTRINLEPANVRAKTELAKSLYLLASK